MSRTHRIFGAGAAGLMALSAIGAPTLASSHREAPAIAFDPSADITDLYAFVSPDKPDTATLIANFTGFQEPGGGPNFYPFNPDVQYWIKVDNTGDGVADISYQFRFNNRVVNQDIVLGMASPNETLAGKGGVDPLITTREREVFLHLTNEGDRQALIQRFWQARDPYPETVRNEAHLQVALIIMLAGVPLASGDRVKRLSSGGPAPRASFSPAEDALKRRVT